MTSSPSDTQASSQVWIKLQSVPTNPFLLPQRRAQHSQRGWFTHVLGSGSTGTVWEFYLDNTNNMFAAKVVESLCSPNTSNRECLYRQFGVYFTFDKAYQSGKLGRQIAPHCYGLYKGTCLDILFLELCVSVLSD